MNEPINTSQSKEERFYYMDLLRIYTIFCMIVLHVSGSYWESQPVTGLQWNVFNMYDSLVRFCVPVFVMISGALLLGPEKKISIYNLYTKKIFRILTAFIFWSVAYAFFTILTDIYNHKSLTYETFQSFLSKILNGEYHLWFCYMIVGLYVAVPLLRKIAESEQLIKYFLILSFTTSILIPTLQLSGATVVGYLDINIGLGYTFYFMLGYYLSKKKLSTMISNLIYVLGIAGAAFIILYSRHMAMVLQKPFGYYSYFTLFCMLEAIAVFVFFKNNSEKILKTQHLKNIVVKFSSLCFGIYLVHVFVLMMFATLGINTIMMNPFISVPLIALSAFIISGFISWTLHKIPILKKYIV